MRKYSIEEALNIGNQVTRAATFFITSLTAFAIGVVLVKLLWMWAIPDILPGAVNQGLITDDLTWLAALKLVGLFAAMSAAGALAIGRWSRQS